MTEAEWIGCDRPHWMLKHLRPWKKRERKMLLYVCASFRRAKFWDHLKEPCLILLDVAERHADGLVGSEEYKTAKQSVSKMTQRDKLSGGEDGPPLYGQALLDFMRLKHLPGWEGVAPKVERCNYLGDEIRQNREIHRSRGMAVITEEQAVEVQKEYDAFMEDHTNFLRDIFGNPFRPITLDPTWLPPTVKALAQKIYDDRTFDQMPLLANELEKAGCKDNEILAHCRETGSHVRGCWVVDLVLGKE
jgi:hypothetical protein